ncbi:MAG: 16S rRNA (guanine(527)-N(7))-methyltransferase RsmG [Leptolyngbya sp. BL-A-14]
MGSWELGVGSGGMGEYGEQGDEGRLIGESRSLESQLLESRSPLLLMMEELWQSTLHWQPNGQQQAQLQQLYALTLAGNRQFNLTRITEPEEFWEKHLWDSLRGVQRFLGGERQEAEGRRQEAEVELQDEHVVERSQDPARPHPTLPTLSPTPTQIIDIGTGAGFPGLPVAIAQPNWTVTLLDATRKKITFIDQVIAQLGLANARTLVDRVEQVGRQKHQRETYDLALIRAVAAASVCAEYALPLLKVGGVAVLYRGQWTDAETSALEAAVAILGGKIESIEAFTTPLTQGDRHCIYLKKIASTPNEFPRAIGIPAQKPLGA